MPRKKQTNPIRNETRIYDDESARRRIKDAKNTGAKNSGSRKDSMQNAKPHQMTKAHDCGSMLCSDSPLDLRIKAVRATTASGEPEPASVDNATPLSYLTYSSGLNFYSAAASMVPLLPHFLTQLPHLHSSTPLFLQPQTESHLFSGPGSAFSAAPFAHPRGINAANPAADSLKRLNTLVSNVGHQQQSSPANVVENALSSSANSLSFQELWWRYVRKEENAEMKRLNQVKQIFTCLQCHASFETMDQLVKHMEMTRHFNNVPRHYSWSLQYARQKMRQMRVKMKYSDRMAYYCHLCHQAFTEAVHTHFSTAHEMHNPAHTMNLVQVITVDGRCASASPAAFPGCSHSHRTTKTAILPKSTILPPERHQQDKHKHSDDDRSAHAHADDAISLLAKMNSVIDGFDAIPVVKQSQVTTATPSVRNDCEPPLSKLCKLANIA